MVLKKCPKCKEYYKDYPAISRVDNHTEICSLCGTTEAIVQFKKPNIKLSINKLSKMEKTFRKHISTMVDGLIEEFNNK